MSDEVACSNGSCWYTLLITKRLIWVR